MKLTVNGKTEIVSSQSLKFDSLNHFQIGRPFVSAGRFDELKLYNAKK